MALTRSLAQALASTPNAAGATTNSATFAIGYGVTGLIQMANGASAPTVPCSANLQMSNDGGTTWFAMLTYTAGTAANTSYPFPISFGVGGAGGDFGHYRIQFTANTAQAVTVQYDGQSTTAL